MSYSPNVQFAEPVSSATNGKAVAALVLGLLSFFFWLLAGIPAIILGILALTEIGRSPGMRGRGMAISGIVLGVITIVLLPMLAFLMFSAFSSVFDTVRMTAQRTHGQNVGKAMLAHRDKHQEFPGDIRGPNGEPLLSWRVAILPMIGENALYGKFHLNEPWNSDHNRKLIESIPAIYRPVNLDMSKLERLAEGRTTLCRPLGADALFGIDGKASARIPDGEGETIMLLDVNVDDAVIWSQPGDQPVDIANPRRGLGDNWQTGTIVVTASAHPEVVSNEDAPKVLPIMFTPNGKAKGEPPLPRRD